MRAGCSDYRRIELLGLDETILSLCETILRKTLEHDKLVPRPQVLEALEQAGISTAAGRGYHILWHLSLRGVTYVGPMQGKQPTFGLLDNLSAPGPKESLAELTRRYFTSHGPATREDFSWWSGLTAADVKLGLAANTNVLCQETVEGKDYWQPRDAKADTTASIAASAAFFLPGFDEYMLGYKDRSAALHRDYASQIVPGGNGMFLSTVVIHGQVVGTWKRRLQKGAVQLTITPFQKLTKADRQLLEVPAERYGKFLGLSPQMDRE